MFGEVKAVSAQPSIQASRKCHLLKTQYTKTSWQLYSFLQHWTGISTSGLLLYTRNITFLNANLVASFSQGTALETHTTPYAVSQNNRQEQTSKGYLVQTSAQGCPQPWSCRVLSVFRMEISQPLCFPDPMYPFSSWYLTWISLVSACATDSCPTAAHF